MSASIDYLEVGPTVFYFADSETEASENLGPLTDAIVHVEDGRSEFWLVCSKHVLMLNGHFFRKLFKEKKKRYDIRVDHVDEFKELIRKVYDRVGGSPLLNILWNELHIAEKP